MLEGPLSEEQRQRLLQIADRCPVAPQLTSEIKIRTRLGWTFAWSIAGLGIKGGAPPPAGAAAAPADGSDQTMHRATDAGSY